MLNQSEKVKDLIEELTKQYIVEYNIKYTGHHFRSYIVNIWDPLNRGLAFSLDYNEDLEPTSFGMSAFHFGRFSIAENYDQEEILKAAITVLEGRHAIKVSRFMKTPSVCFLTSQGEVCGKYKGSKNDLIFEDLKKSYRKKK